jgi:hypothetical protein
MEQQSDDATMSTGPTTDTTDDGLVDDIMGQFGVDFDTLCVHVAERKQEELKAEGKHPHHRPTKRSANPVVAPPGDVRRLLGDKVKTIGGTPYEVKCAGTTPAPTDVDIDSIIYLVKMVDCIYRVSTNDHSEVTGALNDRGANGGIAGNDCQVIEVNDQPQRYVNVEGIDGHGEAQACHGWCGHSFQPWTRGSHHASVCSLRKRPLHSFFTTIGMEWRRRR